MILALQKNYKKVFLFLLKLNKILLIFVQDITEHQNLFLELLSTQMLSMYGLQVNSKFIYIFYHYIYIINIALIFMYKVFVKSFFFIHKVLLSISKKT